MEIQGMSLDELWGHCIGDRTIVQESPTALIINSNPGYVFMSTPMSEWVHILKDSLSWCLYAQDVSSGDVHWVAAGFWGPGLPSLPFPIFFKIFFPYRLLLSFGQSHMRWSGLPHPKQLLFFCWHGSTTFVKQMIYSIGWSVPFPLSDALTSLSAEGSISLSPSWFTPESSSTSSLPTVAAQTVKIQLPFSLHEGNKFQGSENMLHSTHWLQLSLGAEGLWPLPFFPAFAWLSAGQSTKLDFHHPLYEPAFTGIQD